MHIFIYISETVVRFVYICKSSLLDNYIIFARRHSFSAGVFACFTIVYIQSAAKLSGFLHSLSTRKYIHIYISIYIIPVCLLLFGYESLKRLVRRQLREGKRERVPYALCCLQPERQHAIERADDF